MHELHDKYFRLAKREGKLARSYYKLAEIDRRCRIIRPGQRIVDLGACPGSWLEYVMEKTNDNGKFCAVDLKPIDKKFKGKVVFHKGDIRAMMPEQFAEVSNHFDVVLSDMAPNTSGIKIVDQARSLELCEAAADFASRLLEKGGSFVCKIFDSVDVNAFREKLRKSFGALRTIKPDASRDESTETYIVCTRFGEKPEPKRERSDHETRKTKGKRTRQY